MRKPSLSLLLVSLACFALHPAFAQVQSGTNSIRGTVRFLNADLDILELLGPPGNEGMTQLVVYAYTDAPDIRTSSKFISEADSLVQPYEITVSADNVPLTYHAYADLVLDGLQEEYWTAIGTAAPLTTNSMPATLDFDECVAVIELQYVDSLGHPVPSTGGRATVYETQSPYNLRARYESQKPGRTNNFLVVPSGIEIELAVEVDTGTDIYLDRITRTETHTLLLACDDRPVILVTLPAAGSLGRMSGQANLVGEIELPTEGYLELLGRPVVKAAGPSHNQRYAVLSADTPGGDTSRPFELKGLVPSTATERWNVFAEMQFGNGYRFEYFRSPGSGEGLFNPGSEVTGGNTTDLHATFVMIPARLVGTLTLSGPTELPGQASGLRGLVRATDYDADMDGIPDGIGSGGISGSYVIGTGVDELAPGASVTTMGGSATASFAGAFNTATASFEGDYEIVVGMLDDQPGVWRHDGLALSLYQPDTNSGPYLNEQIHVIEDAPWQGVLAPGDRATNNLYYGFAEVCVRIRSSTPFFGPRIVNTYGGLNGMDSMNQMRSYHVTLGSASAPPYSADEATFEAVVVCYVPEGTYSLQPAISIPDANGGVSETQLPQVNLMVVAGERYCVEDCLRIVITEPACSATFGFITYADVFACEATLTNLSLTTRSVAHPEIRLGYSDIRILEPVGVARTTLRTAHGLFPEFDGYPREYYSNLVVTAVASDNRGRIATRQILAHYDLTPPTLNCPEEIVATSGEGAPVTVEFTVTATDDRPEPLLGPTCVPPSGSMFMLGTTLVTCTASDLCRNTNKCAFNVIVQLPACALVIKLISPAPAMVMLAWDCPGTLESAPAVDGPWSDVMGAVSPHMMAAAPPHKFFRVRRDP